MHLTNIKQGNRTRFLLISVANSLLSCLSPPSDSSFKSFRQILIHLSLCCSLLSLIFLPPLLFCFHSFLLFILYFTLHSFLSVDCLQFSYFLSYSFLHPIPSRISYTNAFSFSPLSPPFNYSLSHISFFFHFGKHSVLPSFFFLLFLLNLRLFRFQLLISSTFFPFFVFVSFFIQSFVSISLLLFH